MQSKKRNFTNFRIPALLIVVMGQWNFSIAQENSSIQVTWEGFVDIYYGYDFSRPMDHVRQPFLYNHNRHNQINLNLGMVRGKMEGENVRATLGLQAGTYGEDNYAAEQGMLKHVFEANVGLALNKGKNLWLDAGIFPSHLGFESALSVENLTLSRSLAAENSPYFLSGAKLTYDPSEKLTLLVLVSNGWQRIGRPIGNQSLAFGTQVNFHPSDRFSFNWSTFVGNDYPETAARMRYFNNFYATWANGSGFDLIVGMDIGLEQRSSGNSGLNSWFVPTIIARTTLSDRWYVAGRLEHYSDPKGVIIAYEAPAAFNTTGLSLNFDHEITNNAMVRFEVRHFTSADPIFLNSQNTSQGNFQGSNTTLLTSIAVKF